MGEGALAHFFKVRGIVFLQLGFKGWKVPPLSQMCPSKSGSPKKTLHCALSWHLTKGRKGNMKTIPVSITHLGTSLVPTHIVTRSALFNVFFSNFWYKNYAKFLLKLTKLVNFKLKNDNFLIISPF
jgi:hypothetical protein